MLVGKAEGHKQSLVRGLSDFVFGWLIGQILPIRFDEHFYLTFDIKAE